MENGFSNPIWSIRIQSYAIRAMQCPDCLPKKDQPWKWRREQQSAFDALIEAFTSPPMLKHFDLYCRLFRDLGPHFYDDLYMLRVVSFFILRCSGGRECL